jgi:hypothetical protein
MTVEKLHDLPVEERLAVVKKKELEAQTADVHIECHIILKNGDRVITEQHMDTTLSNILNEFHLQAAEIRIRKTLEGVALDPAFIDISAYVRDMLEKYKLYNDESSLFGPQGNMSIPLGDDPAIPMLDSSAPIGLPGGDQ